MEEENDFEIEDVEATFEKVDKTEDIQDVEPVIVEKPPRKKRVMSEEQKKQCVERLKKAREVKAGNVAQRKIDNPKNPSGRPAGKELKFSREKASLKDDLHQKEIELLKRELELEKGKVAPTRKRVVKKKGLSEILNDEDAPRVRKPRQKKEVVQEQAPLSSMDLMRSLINRNY